MKLKIGFLRNEGSISTPPTCLLNIFGYHKDNSFTEISKSTGFPLI